MRTIPAPVHRLGATLIPQVLACPVGPEAGADAFGIKLGPGDPGLGKEWCVYHLEMVQHMAHAHVPHPGVEGCVNNVPGPVCGQGGKQTEG